MTETVKAKHPQEMKAEMKCVQWRRTSLSVHRQLYTDQCKLVNRLLRQTKANYYKDKLKECKTDQKALFKVIDDLMYRSSTEGGIFPQASSLENRALAQRLNDFFIEKIDKIREDLHQEKLMSYIPEHIPKPVPAEFSSFVPLSDTDIQKLIISRPTKHCDLDPIPTWLLKQCSGTFLPIIKSIINASLLSGLFPDNLKEAILKPLLKKLGLDPECFKNLRPISNLAFISKLIECAVCNQYNTHIFSNDIAEIYQSPYKASHSVETAIVCVHNDIVRAIDNKQAVLLVLLDLSAAFDTVDHCKLLEVLKNVVGISGTALAWFASYLQDRTQKVSINNEYSPTAKLKCGVPQGSVLGPVLFTTYLLPLGEILRELGVKFHCYADDTQFVYSCLLWW